MWLKITQLKVELSLEEKNLTDRLSEILGLSRQRVKNLAIQHKSLDARHKEPIFVYHLIFEADVTEAELRSMIGRIPNLTVFLPTEPIRTIQRKAISTFRPVVIGAGPAGLFAGLRLAAAGLRPIIIEQGDGLAERVGKVNRFWTEGVLDPRSNIQFGIGGAGTFSDGKLMTRIKDPNLAEILQVIVRLGGPPDILYWQHPHIGTDLLRNVVTNLQELIIEYGGEIRFQHRMTDIELEQGKLRAIRMNDRITLETDLAVLAIGNSARDVYKLLAHKKFNLAVKPFAIGLRIEHPQDLINKAQYGKWAGHPKLGPAEYRLTFQHQETGRGVYTFCMCPGGLVIGAASEFNTVVTNGMSYHLRDSGLANAAIIVTVNQKDFEDNSPLAGVAFQKNLESKAFKLGGANYFAPVQRVADFLKNEPSVMLKEFPPSYLPGYAAANLWDLLPPSICQAIKDGIKYFGRQISGFDWPEAVLTGVETRTSAPVRILRDERRETLGYKGVYPVGEGAGYAGGIISSALDGWKTAEEIIERQAEGNREERY